MKGKRGLAGIWQGSAEEASIWSEPDDRFHSVTCCGAELARSLLAMESWTGESIQSVRFWPVADATLAWQHPTKSRHLHFCLQWSSSLPPGPGYTLP